MGNSWWLGGRGGWVPDKIQNFDGGGGWWWVNFQKINGGGGWVVGLKISSEKNFSKKFYLSINMDYKKKEFCLKRFEILCCSLIASSSQNCEASSVCHRFSLMPF